MFSPFISLSLSLTLSLSLSLSTVAPWPLSSGYITVTDLQPSLQTIASWEASPESNQREKKGTFITQRSIVPEVRRCSTACRKHIPGQFPHCSQFVHNSDYIRYQSVGNKLPTLSAIGRLHSGRIHLRSVHVYRDCFSFLGFLLPVLGWHVRLRHRSGVQTDPTNSHGSLHIGDRVTPGLVSVLGVGGSVFLRSLVTPAGRLGAWPKQHMKSLPLTQLCASLSVGCGVKASGLATLRVSGENNRGYLLS